jgi:hypothetical protein
LDVIIRHHLQLLTWNARLESITGVSSVGE